MRICQVVPSLEAHHGGPSRSVYALSAALAREHDVELLTTQPATPSEHLEGRLRIKTFRRQWPQRFCPSAPLAAALRASRHDIVHHHALWLRTLHYAHQHASATRRPLVISPRGMMSAWAWAHHRGRKRFADLFVHPGALRGAAGWHATSVEEEAEIRALGFTQPICVAPNGVAAPTRAEVESARDHWLAACPAAARRPVALFYSRFHRKKRVLELMDLWLEHAPRDWLLLLVGIPEEYTPEQLARRAAERSAQDRVLAFAGTDQPPPYAIASLFVLPSHNENFGLAIAEALAWGVPAAVTDTTPWKGLNDEQRGWCVPWAQYSSAVLTATRLPLDGLRARGERARAWVLREFSWTNSAQTLAAFYHTLEQPA